jgi:hypothetical protein
MRGSLCAHFLYAQIALFFNGKMTRSADPFCVCINTTNGGRYGAVGEVAMRYRRHIPREVRRYHVRGDIDRRGKIQRRANRTVQ